MTNPMVQGSEPYKRKDYRYIQDKPKIDKMGKLGREVTFFEKAMQRVRSILQKLQ